MSYADFQSRSMDLLKLAENPIMHSKARKKKPTKKNHKFKRDETEIN